MKTSKLRGAALDWAVAKCEDIELINGCYNRLLVDGRMSMGQKMLTPFKPSTDWSQGGPIIERENMQLWVGQQWNASMEPNNINPAEFESGPTPLIAAMRSYVASKLGDEVNIPTELTKRMMMK